MRYVVRSNFFGLELQSGAQDQQVSKDEHAERQIPSCGDEMETDGESSDNPRHSERKEAVAGDRDCLKEPQGDRLCAELGGEPAEPQCGSEGPIDKDGHVTHSLNVYDDEIWEDPGVSV